LLRLENLLKESETKFNKLEHDKEKLEVFAKRSLLNFKEKYMKELQKYKNEKLAMEAKLVLLVYLIVLNSCIYYCICCEFVI
jgi:hypothetical protein